MVESRDSTLNRLNLYLSELLTMTVLLAVALAALFVKNYDLVTLHMT
jgi:hypothetical protein